jgi:alpha-galactosidase
VVRIVDHLLGATGANAPQRDCIEEGEIMPQTKIVVIGVGSASFGPAILGDLMGCPRLRGSTIALCDISEHGLHLMTCLAERLNREWGTDVTLQASTDRREVLPGAEFVIVSIAVDRERCWRQDWEIPLKHGIRQPLGENGGPGAVFHTARNAPIVLDICHDMEDLCPDALLLNFTNPVPRMTLVATRYSEIKAVGLCHQIGMGYGIVGLVLGPDLGLDLQPPEDEWEFYKVVAPFKEQIEDLLDVKAAGINHFTFMLDIRHRHSGENLYPLFARRLQAFPSSFQPLSRRMFDAFGVFPATGDGHLSEYVHWAHDPQTKPWVKYGLELYDWDAAERHRDAMWDEIRGMVDGGPIVGRVKSGSGERAIPLILGVLENRNAYEVALDIPNQGYISNLPDRAVVEVPGLVSGFGVRGIGVGPLPEPIAALCRTQLTVASLAVDAAVCGSRELALQALLIDPMVNDIDRARALLEEMLDVQQAYLPRFQRTAGGK